MADGNTLRVIQIVVSEGRKKRLVRMPGYLWDMLMLPEQVFEKLSLHVGTFVYIGILMVGVYNFIFPGRDVFKGNFASRIMAGSLAKILLALVISAVVGLLNVYIFCKPLHGFLINRKYAYRQSSAHTVMKLVKVYIYSHVPIIFISTVIRYLMVFNVYRNDVNVGFLTLVILPLWFSYIISRGCNIVYKIKGKYAAATFIAVFVWFYLVSEVFHYLSSFLGGYIA